MARHDIEVWDVTEGARQYTAHVLPVGDLIEHQVDVDGDCVCGPAPIPVETAAGLIGWVYFHHSLDGRELDGGQGGA